MKFLKTLYIFLLLVLFENDVVYALIFFLFSLLIYIDDIREMLARININWLSISKIMPYLFILFLVGYVVYDVSILNNSIALLILAVIFKKILEIIIKSKMLSKSKTLQYIFKDDYSKYIAGFMIICILHIALTMISAKVILDPLSVVGFFMLSIGIFQGIFNIKSSQVKGGAE